MSSNDSNMNENHSEYVKIFDDSITMTTSLYDYKGCDDKKDDKLIINEKEQNNVYEKLLENKMCALELNENAGSKDEIHIENGDSYFRNNIGGCDGSDSGVEIAASVGGAIGNGGREPTTNIELQRALSSNSGGYASSSNGCLDEIPPENISCDSSMISCSSSDLYENKTGSTILSQNNSSIMSENGSESSSLAGISNSTTRKPSIIKKKIASTPDGTVGNNQNLRKTSSNERAKRANSVENDLCGMKMSSSNSTGHLSNKNRHRLSRTSSLTRPNGPNLQTRDRARSREKSVQPTTPPIPSGKLYPSNSGQIPRSTTPKRPPKPDSLPSPLVHITNLQRSISQRAPSVTRTRTPSTPPTDDGRWPSVGGKGVSLGPRRAGSAAPDLSSIKTRVNILSKESKFPQSTANNISNALDKYGTLPRTRKQKSVEDLTAGRSSRSSSASRENKMTSSVILPPTNRKLFGYTGSMRESLRMQSSPSTPSTLPRGSKLFAQKTKIYHETSIQTAITCQDIEKIFSGGIIKDIKIDAAEYTETGTQSDIRDKEIESLKEIIHKLRAAQNELENKLKERTAKMSNVELQLTREREEKLNAQKELHMNTERVIGMLELARGTPTEENGCDSLLMLESQIQLSGHELEQKQAEINKLRRICRTLQNEMEKSLVAQEALMQEKATIERESSELQDFLQNEKTAMYDALKDTEAENQEYQKRLRDKEEEIKVLHEECRHLVRLNEQRRQENKAMQSKYQVLETKSKDLIVQQNTAVSSASMALSSLHSRLENLVEQLISSYNISERDLEDVVFHNEAYTNSASSCEGSPEYESASGTTGQKLTTPILATDDNDGSLSPQRNQSFIAAVISAIKNATSSSSNKRITRTKRTNEDQNAEGTPTGGDESDSTEMLDSETEPCLMMDNVLEDVPMPDSHSHNMISSSGMLIPQIDISNDVLHATGSTVADESLHNLSQAITNRQQIEMQIHNSLLGNKNNAQLKNNSQYQSIASEDISGHDSLAEMPSISDYCSAQALVDQVIEVDNLVTKLLKVLRLIQMDNDNCIQQLITDKNKLQLNKEEMLEKMKDLEDINVKLHNDLMDATKQLMLKDNDLTNSKNELQRHRNEIDVRF